MVAQVIMPRMNDVFNFHQQHFGLFSSIGWGAASVGNGLTEKVPQLVPLSMVFP